MNRCTFSQTTRFTNLKPPHEITFEQVQCENMIEEQFDEYGRAYCKEHRFKVENIRRKMAQKYINEYKEKLLEHIKNINFKGIFGLLIEKIENGEID